MFALSTPVIFQNSTARWTLAAGGDIMLNGLNPSAKRLMAASSLFKNADVSFANLEVPLTNSSKPTPNKSAKEVLLRQQFVLKASPGHATQLKLWGLKAVTTGNNHAMDFGQDGLRQMLETLDRKEIPHTGAGLNWEAAWKPIRFKLPSGPVANLGAALAFAGAPALRKCTPAKKTMGGVAILTITADSAPVARTKLVHLVSKLRENGGPVILYLHWGTERTSVPRDYQVALGRACIDAGADVVLGAHPHVFQGAELYKGKPILYSLGNLLSPSPGRSGVAQINFVGRKAVAFRLFPFLNVGGQLIKGKPAQEAQFLAEFKKDSEAIAKKFPNQYSVPLTDGWTEKR